MKTDEPGRLLRGRLGVRPRRRRTCTTTRRSPTRRSARLPGRRLRDRPAPQHRLRELHAGVARAAAREPARAFAATWPSLHAAGLQPHALRRLERLGDARRRSSARKGIRFDTNYYYQGPDGWLTKPGLLTGSGFPQRFADLDGSMIDVYQSMTQVTDETDERHADDRRSSTRCSTTRSAPKGYYGVFNVHPAHRLRRPQQREHDGRRGAAPRRAGRHAPSRCSTGSTAATARRSRNIAYSGGQLTFSLSANAEGARPRGDAAGELRDRPAHASCAATASPSRGTRARSRAWTTSSSRRRPAPTPRPTRPTRRAPDDHARLGDRRRRGPRDRDVDARTSRRPRWSSTAAPPRSATRSRTPPRSPTTRSSSPASRPARRTTSASPPTDARRQHRDLARRPPATFTHAARARSSTRARPSSPPARAPTPTPAHTLDGHRRRGRAASPTVGEEFDGAALPAGWISQALVHRRLHDGSAAAALLADGAVATPTTFYAGPRTLEFAATFQPVNDQGVGFSNDFSDYPFAAFTTGNNGDPFGSTPAAAPRPGERRADAAAGRQPVRPAPLPDRVDASTRRATTSTARSVATHNVTIAGPMRPMASATSASSAPACRSHWLRDEHATRQRHVHSRVLDGGPGRERLADADGDQPTLPAGTAITYQTRTGATPDAGRELVGVAERRRRRRRREPGRALHPVPRAPDAHDAADADAPARPDHARRRHRPRAGARHGQRSRRPRRRPTRRRPRRRPASATPTATRSPTTTSGSATARRSRARRRRTLNLALAGNGDLRRQDPRRGLRDRRPRRGERRRVAPRRSPARRRRPAPRRIRPAPPSTNDVVTRGAGRLRRHRRRRR